MEFQRIRDQVDQKVEFPADRATVVDAIGAMEIDPAMDGSETVATVLNRAEATTYETPTALFNTIRGTVSDDYVGRTEYDDRGDTSKPRDQESL